MSQDLIIRLEASGRAVWSVVDRESGERTVSGAAGPDEELTVSGTDAVDRTLVLLPSELIFLTTLDLPARSEAEARQAAPFMIEDELASRLADTQVVPGPRGQNRLRWVAAADRECVAEWTARIASVAVRPVHVVPDCAAGAELDVAISLFDRGDSVLWMHGAQTRKPGMASGGAVDARLFNSVIGPLVRSAEGGPVAVSASLGLAGENFRQVPRGDLDVRASALPEVVVSGFPALLGERLRSRLDWPGLTGPLRRPAILAAAVLLAFCALVAGETAYYRYQSGRFDAATVAEFRAAVPGVDRAVFPAEAERLLDARLAAIGGGETSPFLQLMAGLTELTADSDSIRIDHVRFDRSRAELSVSALYSDFSDFDALNERARTLGLSLSDGGARESGRAIQGEFTVRLQ